MNWPTTHEREQQQRDAAAFHALLRLLGLLWTVASWGFICGGFGHLHYRLATLEEQHQQKEEDK